ncbi:hypothetical protein F5B20DRAFT_586913 [Whalleya microplaca]|nr:hypothetical protein F5B20DRAFT_586913 [Whalleya microplaca]
MSRTPVKRWYRGDPIPPAFDPCKSAEEEERYNNALRNPNRVYGTGTADDPLVVWMNKIDLKNYDWIWAHNNFAKAIAKSLALTHVWIIKTAHDCQYKRDEGFKIPVDGSLSSSSTGSRENEFFIEPADMHITLRFGTNLYECRLSAHAYVTLDCDGNPHEYLQEVARKFWKDDSNQIELWPWKVFRNRVLQRGEFDLGQSWQQFANMGPFLSTYRPDPQRLGDSYLSPSAENPRAAVNDTAFTHDGNGHKIAISHDLYEEALQVNRDWEEYKALHDELSALENPPEDKLSALWVMREHLATRKRGFMRDAKRIPS